MGDVLSKPITEKHSDRHESETLSVGLSAMQGWRRGMEDAHTAVLNLDPEAPNQYSFFGVYDGHCGKAVATLIGDNLYKRVLVQDGWQRLPKDIPEALISAYIKYDEELYQEPYSKTLGTGATAVSCLLSRVPGEPAKVWCANAGDSRCVLAQSGGRVKAMSYDHKPTVDTERQRILAAGGFIASGRVNGNLALSRALGDFDFKENRALPTAEQAISPKPDIIEHTLSEEDEFLVLACDGIWDVMTNEEVVKFVREQLQDTDDLAHICELTFNKCLAPSAPGIGCDNMTMMIVLFKDSAEYKARQARRRTMAAAGGASRPAGAPASPSPAPTA